MLTQEEATTRVARGAAHLDQVRPGWFTRIDVGTLTMWDPCGCIVGQLCGNFNRDLKRVFHSSMHAVACGANLLEQGAWLNGEPGAVWGVLQDAWITAIADRRLAQGDTADLMTETAGRV